MESAHDMEGIVMKIVGRLPKRKTVSVFLTELGVNTEAMMKLLKHLVGNRVAVIVGVVTFHDD